MKLKVLLLSASVAFLVFNGPVSAGNAKLPQGAVVVSTKNSYAAASVEAQAVLQWLRQQSPEYAPVLEGVKVEVVKKISSSSKSIGAVSPASAPAPPTPLPNSALPGDEYTITTTDRYGNSETWGYTWVSGGGSNGGGGWVLVEYHYKNVNHENQDSPETLG